MMVAMIPGPGPLEGGPMGSPGPAKETGDFKSCLCYAQEGGVEPSLPHNKTNGKIAVASAPSGGAPVPLTDLSEEGSEEGVLTLDVAVPSEGEGALAAVSSLGEEIVFSAVAPNTATGLEAEVGLDPAGALEESEEIDPVLSEEKSEKEKAIDLIIPTINMAVAPPLVVLNTGDILVSGGEPPAVDKEGVPAVGSIAPPRTPSSVSLGNASIGSLLQDPTPQAEMIQTPNPSEFSGNAGTQSPGSKTSKQNSQESAGSNAPVPSMPSLASASPSVKPPEDLTVMPVATPDAVGVVEVPAPHPKKSEVNSTEKMDSSAGHAVPTSTQVVHSSAEPSVVSPVSLPKDKSGPFSFKGQDAQGGVGDARPSSASAFNHSLVAAAQGEVSPGLMELRGVEASVPTEATAAKTGVPLSLSPADLARQIHVHLEQGKSVVHVELHPEHLGELRIHLETRGRDVHMNFTVENEGARQSVTAGLKELSGSLNSLGWTVQGLAVNVSSGGMSDGQAQADGSRWQGAARFSGPALVENEPGPTSLAGVEGSWRVNLVA